MNNEQATTNGIKVGSCSNHILESKATGELPLQELPKKARMANKFDQLPLNLLSMGQVCNKDCVGIFRKHDMLIAKEADISIELTDKPLLMGKQNGNNELWKIPLPPAELKVQQKVMLAAKEKENIQARLDHTTMSAYNRKNAKELAMYLHACAGYPVRSTWTKAIKKDTIHHGPS